MNEKNKKRLAELREKHRGYLTEWSPTEFSRAASRTFATGGVVDDTVAIHPSPFTTWTSVPPAPPSGTTWTHTFPATEPSFVRMSPPPPPSFKVTREVPAPTKSPRKVVVAFLDEDENVEWCGMFWPNSVDLQHRLREPSEMQLSFKLIDANREANE